MFVNPQFVLTHMGRWLMELSAEVTLETRSELAFFLACVCEVAIVQPRNLAGLLLRLLVVLLPMAKRLLVVLPSSSNTETHLSGRWIVRGHCTFGPSTNDPYG